MITQNFKILSLDLKIDEIDLGKEGMKTYDNDVITFHCNVLKKVKRRSHESNVTNTQGGRINKFFVSNQDTKSDFRLNNAPNVISIINKLLVNNEIDLIASRDQMALILNPTPPREKLEHMSAEEIMMDRVEKAEE